MGFSIWVPWYKEDKCRLTWPYDHMPNGIYMMYISEAVQMRGEMPIGPIKRS